MVEKPHYLRMLRKYYGLCHVRTAWCNSMLYIPQGVIFIQQNPDHYTGEIYIKVLYIGTDNGFSFPVRKFSDVLNGIKKYDKSLIYKKWD